MTERLSHLHLFAALLLSWSVVSAVAANPGIPEYCPPTTADPDAGPFTPVVASAVWDEMMTPTGHRLIWHLPADPKGLVFFQHGGGGGSVIVQRLDIMDGLNALVDEGFAFAALDSLDRVVRAWDTEPVATNPDFARLMDVRAGFIASGEITESTPIYFWGFSNGGSAAMAYSKLASMAGVPLKAVATHGSPGSVELIVNPSLISVPTFFTVLENDVAVTGGTVKSHRPDVNLDLFNSVVANGLDAEYHLGLEKALNPLRFTRIPGVTPDLAQEVFDVLVADGVINASGLRLVDLGDLNAYSPDLSGLTSPPGPGFPSVSFFADEVNRQISIVWGRHVVSSEFIDNQVSFFLSNIPEPGTGLLLGASLFAVLTRGRRPQP